MSKKTLHKKKSKFDNIDPSRSTTGDNISLVARQPIFNKKSRIEAYELLFRDSQTNIANIRNSDSATSSVMIDGFNLMRPSLATGQRFYINFTEDLLNAGVASILPPDVCVLEILETSQPTEKLLRSLSELKQAGYTLALDDFCGQKHLFPFLPIVDIVKVDALETPQKNLQIIANALKNKAILLAEKVETPQMETKCKELGFSLFQGFFYSKAEIVSGKTISPTQITKTRLLAFTANDDTTIDEISSAINVDVYLTVKLLQYVNSVYFGLPTKVKSISHAITLLGRIKLRHWLYVTALADLDATPLSREIAYISALRAKFLELLGSKYCARVPSASDLPSSLFMLGIFSLLDKILEVPFSEIPNLIPLEEDSLAALVAREGPMAIWLNILDAYERGNWDKACADADTLGLKDSDLASAYASAVVWSSSFFGDS